MQEAEVRSQKSEEESHPAPLDFTLCDPNLLPLSMIAAFILTPDF
jgi:hypothetical protein